MTLSDTAPVAVADEAVLVTRASTGDAAAFEQLYRLHAGRVHGLCLRMTGQREAAEDCTQETFVNAWRALPGFEVRSAFGTWLHRIAVNTVLARGRGIGRRLESPLVGEDGEELEFEDTSRIDPGTPLDLERAIACLPEGARHVLVLYGVYGYTHEEAAALLGIAAGTCKAQLHRARRLLRERMGMEADA
jgi:RNA polymerase sigma-70 factor (ECF subfamily)